ncbi:Carnitine operon protein CaiE [hydrothermal vent metagenome]|uniref:Carnitine operon protein CaiE n=1 Tax=hydrothermal vent metagenome TaxID=652676 RepID=A0A3B1E7N5_9ZZZZ
MPSYEFEGLTPVVAKSAFIHPTSVLIGDVFVGQGCFVGPGAVMRGDIARLIMQRGSNLQDCCIVHTFPGRETVIGEDSHIGHGAIIHGCTLGRNVMIGMNAVVMDGASIGDEAFVAAQAFVKAGQVVEARTLVAGVPAKVIRTLGDDEVRRKSIGTAIYQHLARRYLETMREVQPVGEVEEGRPSLPGLEHIHKGEW